MAAGDDEGVLAELDRSAPEMLGDGRPIRLVERLDELVRLNFRGHPWARLLVACALYDADPADPRHRDFLMAALRAFRAQQDGRGVAYACFVLGCRALELGNITQAARWWDKSRAADGPAPPGLELMLAHRCLEMYAAGRLREAIAVAEEAVAHARLNASSRAEAAALVNLAFMKLWTGEFGQAMQVLTEAEDGFNEVPDPFDRYESPLCFAARGVLLALRGELARAEQDFTRAVTTARELQAGWYEAIARALRAEFTAAVDPRLARADARWAIRELDRRGDQWWSVWAAQAAGIAAAESGMLTAATTALRQVLAQPQAPHLENARSLLLLGELQLRNHEDSEAAAVLQQAAGIFRQAGADYWQARCCVRLAAADPRHASKWIAQARRLSTTDPAYQLLFDTDAIGLTAIGPGHILRDGRQVKVRTQHSERAIFLLALAEQNGMHAEELAERLWPEAVIEHKRLLGRIRTLLWEIRQVLGAQAWRLERHGHVVTLDMTGAAFDLRDARDAARDGLRTTSPRQPRAVARLLRQPLLTRWQYEEWVRDEQLANERLADRLDRLPGA